MAESPAAVALPGIAALPPTTARQIGSGQVLVDPSSVVKELIDNALDSRAKSIFVDITANTIDSIQVKDDGHGIPAEDRPLVCRRYCTSKIRDFQDLRDVGGKWLGFRGEALSSLAEMSGTLHVATRVEGEPVAAKLKYGRDGELVSVELDSHPVGTTVKVTKFFEHIPVRKQTAIKNSMKCLAKIRRLMQAYALARPTIRFRLRILKVNNNKGDFVYAPKADANLEDAVLKVIGKDCALQCDWTAMEADGFEIHAFLPKPTAMGSKIANQSAFISVDARPVSSSRGTIKQVVVAFKDRLRKSNPSFAGLKDSFFCMNIMCPPDSYDPNIEPAKDDVMFEDNEVILGVVHKLLASHYPEAVAAMEDDEPPTSAQLCHEPQFGDSPARSRSPTSMSNDEPSGPSQELTSDAPRKQPRWRSSMYGIDEDDLELLQENQVPIIEEVEGRRAVDVSNPWTIARMNTTVKPKQPTGNGQLLSPAKSQSHPTPLPSSPVSAITPDRISAAQPLTPQTSSRVNMTRSPLDDELEQSIQRLPRMSPEGDPFGEDSEQRLTRRNHDNFTIPSSPSGSPYPFAQADLQRPESHVSQSNHFGPMSHEVPPPISSAPNRTRRKQPAYTNKPFAPPAQKSNDTWFGQPVRGPQPSQTPRRQKRARKVEVPLFPSDLPSSPHRPGLAAADRLIEDRLRSDNNTDIRDFFGSNGRPQRGTDHGSSFKPTNPQSQSSQLRSFSRSQQGVPIRGNSRASSAEPQPRSQRVRNQLLLRSDYGPSGEPYNMAEQFRAHAEREGPPRLCSAGSQVSILFNERHDDDTRPKPPNMAHQFQAHHNRVPYSSTPRPRSPSLGSERPSLIPQHSRQVATALNKYRPNKPTDNSKEMEAYFRAHETSNTSSAPSPHRQQPRIPPPHETCNKTRRLRRRTTDTLERTKSSRLPLERTRSGFRIANIILALGLNVDDIDQLSRKLDMSRNTPEWGYAAEAAYDVFAERVSEGKIMEWVVRLDGMLDELFERVDGVEVRGRLHEGIQRVIDEREEVLLVSASSIRDGMVGLSDSQAVDSAHGCDGSGTSEGSVGRHAGTTLQSCVSETVDENEDEFDMSPFVDFDAGVVQTSRVCGGAGLVEEEYDEDIEDDMLLDL